MSGTEAWPATPSVNSVNWKTPFSATETSYTRSPSTGKAAPAPSLTRKSQRTRSGRSAQTHSAPLPPTSSSATEITTRSPRAGRQPSRASEQAATTSAAVCDFMSSAPRPHTQPSASAPDQGSCAHPRGSAVTVST